MARINQEVIEYSFSARSCLSYELNILIGSDSIYYMISDAQLNVLVLKSYHFEHQKNVSLAQHLKNTFIEDPILKESFGATRIAITTPHFTLIPLKFYDETKNRLYFQNITDTLQNANFEADTLRNIEFKNVFATDSDLMRETITLFHPARIHHAMSPLILGCQRIAEQLTGKQVFANIRDGKIQLLFFESHNLLFANTFAFQSPQDVAYFTMLVYEQFKLSPETTPLSLSGALTESSELYKILYRYIRHVNWIPIPSYYRLGQQFTGIPAHFYFDLFSIKLCE